MELNKIYNKDCIEGLKDLPDNCIDCCVTSPPYFGLRDYGTAIWEGGDIDCKHIAPPKGGGFKSSTLGPNKDGISPENSVWKATEGQYINKCGRCGAVRIDNQIGLEQTPELYVAKMVEVFTEVKRVLKKEGVLWLNLGDSYNGSGEGGGTSTEITKNNIAAGKHTKAINITGLKKKDLIGIPWMVAFALRSSGWYLRQDIIWHKPNPMPESVTDRCTKAHEYIFLMSKSSKYYYDADAIKSEMTDSSIERLSQNIEMQLGSERVPGKTNGNMKAVGRPNGIVRDRLLNYDSKEKLLRPNVIRGEFENESDLPGPDGKANKRSVWTVTTKPYSEAHFATFPEDLIVDMIKAGCPEGGIILDPFMGAGTTALVAAKLNRNYIGFELNAEYLKIAKKRLEQHLGFFNPAY